MNIRIIILILISCVSLNSAFSRDDAKHIVYDDKTKLEWTDFVSSNPVQHIWIEAIKYCEDLELDNGQWRLPNKKELTTIVDYSQHIPSISRVFNDLSISSYWSSTTYVSEKSSAFIVSFNYGGSEYKTKTTSANVRCVRTRGE